MLVFISPLDLSSFSQSGSSFSVLNCVAIFDRAGILFSPINDMWKDTGDIRPRHSVLDLSFVVSWARPRPDSHYFTWSTARNMEKPNKGFGSRATQRFPDVRDYDGRSRQSFLAHHRPPNLDIGIFAWARYLCLVGAREWCRYSVSFKKLHNRMLLGSPNLWYMGQLTVTISPWRNYIMAKMFSFPESNDIYRLVICVAQP